MSPVGDAIARATADVETIDDLFSSSFLTPLGETARLAATVEALQPPVLYQVGAAGSQPGLMSSRTGTDCPR